MEFLVGMVVGYLIAVGIKKRAESKAKREGSAGGGGRSPGNDTVLK